MIYCDDCGCKVYSGKCVNCHEILYIEDQYWELGMTPPESITTAVNTKLREKPLTGNNTERKL